MRLLKRAGFFSAMAIVAILAGLLIASDYYEDDVKAFLINAINEQLESKVEVEEIDFSLLRKFPHATLSFSNITIAAPNAQSAAEDTLLTAKRLYLAFSMLDLLEEKYIIRKIEVQDGNINLRIDEQGKPNYLFWKQANEKSNGPQFFDLENVQLNSTVVAYTDQQEDFALHFTANAMKFSGQFFSNEFLLASTADIALHSLQSKAFTLQNNAVELDFETRVDRLNKKYDFKTIQLLFNGLSFSGSGQLVFAEQAVNSNFICRGNDLPLNQLEQYLPRAVRETLVKYECSGTVSLNATVKGDLLTPEHLLVNSDFKVERGRLKEEHSGVALREINATGQFFANDKKGVNRVVVSRFSAKLASGEILARGELKLGKPAQLDLNIKSALNLEDLSSFLGFKEIKDMSGRLAINSRIKTPIHSWKKIQLKDLAEAEVSGKVDLSDASIQMAAKSYAYTSLHGTLLLHNNDAALKNFQGKVKETDFELSGMIYNLLPYLINSNERLFMEARCISPFVDLNELLANTAEGREVETYRLQFPERVGFSFQVEIDSLIFRRFTAGQLKGNLALKNQIFHAEPITMRTAKGSFTASATLDGKSKKDQFHVTVASNFKNIDVQELFYSFENFGQSFLQDQHLKGKATANVKFESTLGEHLELLPESIYSLVDITIQNGELIEHPAMNSISDYIEEHGLMRRLIKSNALKKRLEHIKFSTLRNRVEIKNQVVYIPAMEIKSSAIDIELAGEHHFSNAIDYRFNFRFIDLKSKKDEGDFGPIEDDELGSRLFLSMSGSASDPAFSYDHLAAKGQRKKKFEQEKETFKDLIRSEFQSKNKQESSAQAAEENKNVEFVVEDWSPYGESDTTIVEKKEPQPKVDREKKTKLGKFLKKLTEENPDGEQIMEHFEDEEDF